MARAGTYILTSDTGYSGLNRILCWLWIIVMFSETLTETKREEKKTSGGIYPIKTWRRFKYYCIDIYNSFHIFHRLGILKLLLWAVLFSFLSCLCISKRFLSQNQRRPFPQHKQKQTIYFILDLMTPITFTQHTHKHKINCFISKHLHFKKEATVS